MQDLRKVTSPSDQFVIVFRSYPIHKQGNIIHEITFIPCKRGISYPKLFPFPLPNWPTRQNDHLYETIFPKISSDLGGSGLSIFSMR